MRSNRGLSEDEAFLLLHAHYYGRDGYPIHKIGRWWTWRPRGINGTPPVFKTKKEAVKAFEVYLSILVDKLAGRMQS